MKFNIISIILQVTYGIVFIYNGFAIGVIFSAAMIALSIYDIIEMQAKAKNLNENCKKLDKEL